MPRMPNGDVIPSHIDLAYTPQFDGGDAFSNHALRFGEVQEIVYPNDKRSLSKKFVEYRVYVQERSNGTANGRMYEHVLLMNSLAGLADKSFYTLRGSKSAAKPKDNRLGLGSKVLILCINGEVNNAVIIGGLRDEKDESEEKAKAEDLGHHLSWIFNGFSVSIDKDGQLVATYGGKTDADGKRNKDVDQKLTGTRVSFLKDGVWQLEVPGKAKILPEDGLHVGEATDETLLGKSYRDAQKTLNKKLKQFIEQAATQLNTAGGAVAGPFMAAAAGPSIIAAAQLLLQAAQAIEEFESKAEAKNSFLSKKNKSD